MPTYEYECSVCGVFEHFQGMSENPLKKCPECGSRKVQRLISGGAGVIFRGEGFWETDYNRGKDYAKKAEAEKDGGSGQKEKKKEGGGAESTGSTKKEGSKAGGPGSSEAGGGAGKDRK